MSAGESNATSRSLLARARDMEPGAWEHLVELYAPFVHRACRAAGLPRDDVADVFQEVFQTAAARLATFRRERPGDSFRGWLWTLTRNKIIDLRRKRAREPRGVGGSTVLERFHELPAAEPGAEESDVETGRWRRAAEDALLREALQLVRSAVRENTWQAFARTTLEGRPTADVAEELGMAPGAVRVARSRVLQRLRAALGELEE